MNSSHDSSSSLSLEKCHHHHHRSFLLHKPINVVSSTVDPHVSDIIRNKKTKNKSQHESISIDENKQQVVGGTPRLTAYDIARMAGFPTDLGLAGRLDCETSGVMLFTDDSHLHRAVLHPLDCGSGDDDNDDDNDDDDDDGKGVKAVEDNINYSSTCTTTTSSDPGRTEELRHSSSRL